MIRFKRGSLLLFQNNVWPVIFVLLLCLVGRVVGRWELLHQRLMGIWARRSSSCAATLHILSTMGGGILGMTILSPAASVGSRIVSSAGGRGGQRGEFITELAVWNCLFFVNGVTKICDCMYINDPLKERITIVISKRMLGAHFYSCDFFSLGAWF